MFHWSHRRDPPGWRRYRRVHGHILLRSFRFDAWVGWEPELAVLYNNSRQRHQQDTEGDEHPPALLLFKNRWRQGPANLGTAILLHSANYSAKPLWPRGTWVRCCLVCLEIAAKASATR